MWKILDKIINFFLIVVPKKTLEKLIEQNTEILNKVDWILEKQKILEDKVTQLQNKVYTANNSVIKKDFVEVSYYLYNRILLRSTPIISKIMFIANN